jgi:hypothetical protein
MRAVFLTGVLLVAACSESGPTDAEVADQAEKQATAAAYDTAAIAAAQPTPAPVTQLSQKDQGRVCRASIATVMGRDPSIIRVVANDENIVSVRYTRDDGTVWNSRCRVEAGQVTWAAIENGQPGRWRTEDTITYVIDGDQITITESMMGTETYTLR